MVLKVVGSVGIQVGCTCNPERGLLIGSNNVVCGYADANFAGCVDTRRSTTGFVFLMHGSAVAWGSRIQPTIAASTCNR
jgi:hypothetical protein